MRQILVKTQKDVNLAFKKIINVGSNLPEVKFIDGKRNSFYVMTAYNNSKTLTPVIHIKCSSPEIKQMMLGNLFNFTKKLKEIDEPIVKEYESEGQSNFYEKYSRKMIYSQNSVNNLILKLSKYFNVEPPKVITKKRNGVLRTNLIKVNDATVQSAWYAHGRINVKTLEIEILGLPTNVFVVAHEFAHYLLLLKGENPNHGPKMDSTLREVLKNVGK